MWRGEEEKGRRRVEVELVKRRGKELKMYRVQRSLFKIERLRSTLEHNIVNKVLAWSRSVASYNVVRFILAKAACPSISIFFRRGNRR